VVGVSIGFSDGRGLDMAELDFEIELKNYEIVSKNGKTVLRIKAKDVNITDVLDNFFVSEVVEDIDVDMLLLSEDYITKDEIIKCYGKEAILEWFKEE
jgi:hypothetical protein